MVFTKEQELASQLHIKVDSDFRVFGPRDARHVPNPLSHPCTPDVLKLFNVHLRLARVDERIDAAFDVVWPGRSWTCVVLLANCCIGLFFFWSSIFWGFSINCVAWGQHNSGSYRTGQRSSLHLRICYLEAYYGSSIHVCWLYWWNVCCTL